jgi:hypothetical protein
MKFPFKEKIAKLDKNLPPRQTALIASEAFFCRAVEIPQGTLPADIAGFVQLELETRAPFPVENLSWGYLSAGGRALIFAATGERAAAGLEKGLEPLQYALPAFLPFCLETPSSGDSVRLCISGACANAFFMDAGKSLPSKIVSCKLPEPFDTRSDEAIIKARPVLVEKLGLQNQGRIEEGIRVLHGIDTKSEEKITFKIREVKTSQPSAVDVHIAGDALWNADVRGRVFAATTRASRRKDYLAWMAFASAGWTAAALVLISILIVAFSISTGVYHSMSQKHRAEVENLQNKSDFATNLESVTEREMKPFSMIAVASIKRPQGLSYDKVSSSDWNVLRLEGQATRSDLVQTYIEALGKDPNIREVRTLRTSTSGGRSTFDIEVVFKPLEDITTGGQPSAK